MEILIEGLEIWGVGRTPLFNLLKFIGNSDYRQATMLKWKQERKNKHLKSQVMAFVIMILIKEDGICFLFSRNSNAVFKNNGILRAKSRLHI